MIPRRHHWSGWLLLALGSLLLAINLGHWLLPQRSDVVVMRWPVHWIEPPSPSQRAYYRSTIEVPFSPTWAWISVATEDFSLYVNGRIVASNSYTSDITRTLQHRTSDLAQSVTPFSPAVVYKPEIRREANQEWRFPLHVQIAGYLRPGRNVIALTQQSPDGSRFAVRGEIDGDGQHMPIPSDARDWQVSLLSRSVEGAPWYSPQIDVPDWPLARQGPAVDRPFFAADPLAIWTTPMPLAGLTGQQLGGEIRFGLAVPGVEPGATKPSWIRVYSNWAYYLFVNDQLVGTGGARGGAEAWDLTTFQRDTPQRISLRLVEGVETAAANKSGQPGTIPLVVIDGSIGGWRFSDQSDWQKDGGAGSDWLAGSGHWQPARRAALERPPAGVTMQFPTELGRMWYGGFAVLWLLCAVVLWAVYHGLRSLERMLGRDRRSAGGDAVWILSLVMVGVAATELLRLRLVDTDTFFFLFGTPEHRWLLQVLCPLLLILSMVGFYTTPTVTRDRWSRWLRRHSPTIALCLILAIAIGLRLFRIGFEDLQDDENVSWDAARGILHGGLPVETSGIFYTRSMLYHYVLAGCLWLFGDNKTTARLFSVIPGVLTVWLTYRLAFLVCGRRHIPALLAALVLAIDPWQLRNSQDIRFYQQVQMFSVASMEAFILGFIDRRKGKFTQNLFFVLVGAGCFSQEVFVLTFPGYCIAALYFYRPWRWRENINVCVGFVTVLTLVLYDIVNFEIMTLTANNGISSSDAPAMMLHLWNPTTLLGTFFLGYLRLHLVFSVAFFVGLGYWLLRPNPRIGTLYIQIVWGLAAATILVVQVEARYVYIFYPFLVVLATATVSALLREAAVKFSAHEPKTPNLLRTRWLGSAGLFCALALVACMEPGKILKSYHYPINMKQESAFWFIVDHRRPGDIIVSNTPDVAATVTHGLDYFLTNLVYFDALYERGNHLVERWAGGTVITNPDMLRKVLLTHDRVWLVVSDDHAKGYDTNLTALLDSAEIKYEWLGGRVLLWERDKGRLNWTADNNGAINSY